MSVETYGRYLLKSTIEIFNCTCALSCKIEDIIAELYILFYIPYPNKQPHQPSRKIPVLWKAREFPFLISAVRSIEASLSFLSFSRQMQGRTTVQTLPGLLIFKVSNLRLQKVKLLKGAPNLCLWGMKAQSHEGGERTLLGDNRGGGAVTLRQIRFWCIGTWIANGLPFLCIYNGRVLDSTWRRTFAT
jgi:hypothetical protein